MLAAASEAALLRAGGLFLLLLSDSSTSPCSTSSEEDVSSRSCSRRALLCSCSLSSEVSRSRRPDAGKYFFQYDDARKVTMALKRSTAPKIKL